MRTAEVKETLSQSNDKVTKLLRIVPHLAEISRPAFAIEQTTHFRSAVATILGGNPDDPPFNYRSGISLALERLRRSDAQTLQYLKTNIDQCQNLLKIDEPLLTDDEGKKTRKESRRIVSASQVKLCRFLLAAYFTEKWWQFRDDIDGVERVFSEYSEQVDIYKNESLLSFSYDGQLYELYKKSLEKTPFDCHSHIEAGISTGRFYSDAFLRLVVPVYREHLRVQGCDKFTSEDESVILAIGESTVPLVAKLAAIDFSSFITTVHLGGAGNSGKTNVAQNPDNYCILKEAIANEGVRWSLQLKPEILQRLQSSGSAGIGCPASYARTPEGTLIVMALARERLSQWSEHIRHAIFDEANQVPRTLDNAERFWKLY